MRRRVGEEAGTLAFPSRRRRHVLRAASERRRFGHVRHALRQPGARNPQHLGAQRDLAFQAMPRRSFSNGSNTSTVAVRVSTSLNIWLHQRGQLIKQHGANIARAACVRECVFYK